VQTEIDERVMPHLDRVRATVGELETLSASPGVASPAVLASRLADAAAEVTGALEELRTVARGVFPPLLADAGLPAALDGWLDRLALPVTVRLDGDLGRLRENPELQACCYFCLVTALSGFRAAALTELAVEVALRTPQQADNPAGSVRWSLTGRGATAVNEATLTAVRDRVLAFDGSMELSRDGDAHMLIAILPMTTGRSDLVWEGAR
jgi:signal transduction histidine kinase